jgi:hypothetical protein
MDHISPSPNRNCLAKLANPLTIYITAGDLLKANSVSHPFRVAATPQVTSRWPLLLRRCCQLCRIHRQPLFSDSDFIQHANPPQSCNRLVGNGGCAEAGGK